MGSTMPKSPVSNAWGARGALCALWLPFEPLSLCLAAVKESAF